MDRDRFKRKPTGENVSRPAQRPAPRFDSGEVRPATPAVRPHSTASSHASRHPKPAHVQPPKPAPVAAVPETGSAESRILAAVPEPDIGPMEMEIPSTFPPQKQKRLSKRRITEIALVGLVLVGVGCLLLKPNGKEGLGAGSAAISGLHVNANGAATNSTATVAGTVPFTPVTPAGKTQLANLGSSAYNAEYKSYSYDDTYMSQKLRVSQQELPSGQNSAAGLIDKIAASLKAQSVTPVTIQSGQPAYILNNTSNAGSQVVVFTVNGKLVFVQAATAFDPSIWPDYLNTFQ